MVLKIKQIEESQQIHLANEDGPKLLSPLYSYVKLFNTDNLEKMEVCDKGLSLLFFFPNYPFYFSTYEAYIPVLYGLYISIPKTYFLKIHLHLCFLRR